MNDIEPKVWFRRLGRVYECHRQNDWRTDVQRS